MCRHSACETKSSLPDYTRRKSRHSAQHENMSRHSAATRPAWNSLVMRFIPQGCSDEVCALLSVDRCLKRWFLNIWPQHDPVNTLDAALKTAGLATCFALLTEQAASVVYCTPSSLELYKDQGRLLGLIRCVTLAFPPRRTYRKTILCCKRKCEHPRATRE